MKSWFVYLIRVNHMVMWDCEKKGEALIVQK